MKIIPLFTIVDIDDWSALYEDDRAVHQGHETRAQDLIEAAHGRPFMLRHVRGGDKFSLQASEHGELPQSLALVMEIVVG
jgi:hypothetical protein